MAERIGGLIGLVAALVAVVAAIALIGSDAAEQLAPGGPGEAIPDGEDDWLVDSPGRTHVDLDELQAAMFEMEHMVRQAIPEPFEVEYRSQGGPPDGSGPVIGARGEALVTEAPTAEQLAAAGFQLIDVAPPPVLDYPTDGPTPQLVDPLAPIESAALGATYPTVPPATRVLYARGGGGDLVVERVGAQYQIRFARSLAYDADAEG